MKDTLMTGFHFFKRLYITHDMKKSAKTFFSQLKLTMGAAFIFSILRCVKRKANLQRSFSEKMSLVVNTLKHKIVLV